MSSDLRLQNAEDVQSDLPFLQFICSLWLYTTVVALVGAPVWFDLSVMHRHRRRSKRP